MGTAPDTALASRDRMDVPTAKRRARRRSEAQETSTEPVEARSVSEKTVTLPPSGSKPDDTPTRSMTQNTQGAEGRMTMRIVALDLGVKKTSYCELSAGQVVERATVAEVSTLKPLLGPEQPPARVAIEACRQAWFVHDCLVEWGNEVVLVDTTRSRQLGIGQHGRKTDRIDAETLARALEAGRIPAAHVLSPKRRELRRVLGVRRTLVESRAQLMTTIRGLVREQGATVGGCQADRFIAKVREQRFAPEITQYIDPLLEVMQTINERLVGVEEQLAVLCAAEETIARLTTVTGIGTVIAACFMSVVDDAERFQSAHQLESYLGLVPSEDTSGGKRKLGAITKKGNSYLRALLVQAAWTILRTSDKDDPLYLWAKKVEQRRGKRIAVVALARRLVGVLWAMWRDGTVYDAKHLAQQGIRGVRGAVQSLEQQKEKLEKAAKKESVKHPKTSPRTTPRRSSKISAVKAA
jgi:transposase